MKIVNSFPPNILAIRKVFPITVDTIYAYGDTLYVPNGKQYIDPDLMIHEETHERQQKALGVEAWWAMYIENPAFRLSQEVEAYRNQYQFLKTVLNRHGRKGALQQIAQDLSSELYGSIITKKEAQELIDV